jgi:acyl-CoA thioesterase YciA
MTKITSKLCMVKDLGVNGNLFGGFLCQWVDEAAAIHAHQFTGEKRMVTLKFNDMTFKKSIKEGEIIEFYAGKDKIGNTSHTFEIIAMVKDVLVFETTCVFVAVDKNGNKQKIWKK